MLLNWLIATETQPQRRRASVADKKKTGQTYVCPVIKNDYTCSALGNQYAAVAPTTRSRANQTKTCNEHCRAFWFRNDVDQAGIIGEEEISIYATMLHSKLDQ